MRQLDNPGSNGVIFEEAIATLMVAHQAEALEQLEVQIRAQNLDQLWKGFSDFIGRVCSVAMTTPQSERAIQKVLHLPGIEPDDHQERREGIAALLQDVSPRLAGYRTALGENAYAVFNTLTDLAARPPETRYFQKDRDTLEKRAGRWLRQLGQQRAAGDFDLEKFIDGWQDREATPRPVGQN